VEILHTFLFHANVVGRLAIALARIRRWRGNLLSSQRTAAAPLWRRWAEHATVRAHERVVCVSEHVASFARTQLGVSEAQVVVIPNGVEVPADDRVKPAQLDGPWICTARLSRDKRHDDLIDAWRTMAADGAPPRLVLVGGGERTAELRARAAGLPIELLGERADVRKLLNEACGFVFGAAVAEGCPNAVLEAMAEGLPVVATDTPGLREIVVPEETGLLVAGGDARALAAAVRLLDDDASLRRRFGAAGRERVRERFSLAATVCAYDRLYQAPHPDVANPL
jgi:glycosyltransferase involved in cell wall biosynthesis